MAGKHFPRPRLGRVLSRLQRCLWIALAGLLAVGYLIQDRNLKRRAFGGLTSRLPALEAMDRLMSIQVGVAFLMLTVSIVLGVLLVRGAPP